MSRIGLGNLLQYWALLHAVAAPNAADDKHLHVPLKTADKLSLRRSELRGGINLMPGLLLILLARSDITIIGQCRGEFLAEVRGIHCNPPKKPPVGRLSVLGSVGGHRGKKE